MDTVICLKSAWEYWHVARVSDDPDLRADPVARCRSLDIARSRVVSLAGTAPGSASLSALQRGFAQFEAAWLSDGGRPMHGLTAPLHVLAARGGTYRQLEERVVHRVSSPLPAESLVRIENGLLASSPEHLYLQAAGRLDALELAWFASELCALFSIHPSGDGGLLPAQPLTTVKRLTSYLETACAMDVYGAKKALSSLRHVVEHAASRREIACALRMCLPRSWGGRGIPKAVLNYGLGVDKRLCSVHGWERMSLDMAWPDARLAVEYDSDSFHLDSRRRARDNDKRAVLEQMGWRVIPMSTRQFDSIVMSDDVFRRVGACLGVKNRAGETRYDWQARRSDLNRRLWKLCDSGIEL